MRVRPLIYTLVMAMALPLFAQTNTIDSLRNELSIAGKDTSQVLLLNRLAFSLHKPNPTEGIIYASKSVALAKELDFQKGLAHAYNSLGACYWNKTELDSALKYYQLSYELNQELQDVRGSTGALSNMAIIYENRGDYVNSIDTYVKALGIMREEKLVRYAAITSNNLGIALMNIGSYPEALEYFHEAYMLGDSLEMTNLIGPTLINIGRIYHYIGEPELELEYKMKALVMGIEANDPLIIGLASNNVGNLYKERGELDSALLYYQRALSINTEIGRKSSISLNMSNIGVIYREQGKYDKSIEFLNLAIDMAKEAGQALRFTRANYQLGLTIKGQQGCDAAISYFETTYAIAQEKGMLRELENVSKELYDCNAQLGRFEEAYRYLLEYTAANDSLINEENIKELTKIESKYQFQNQIKTKNDEIKLLESRKKVADLQFVFLAIGALLSMVIVFLVARIMIQKRDRRKRELEAIARFRESMTGMIAHDLKSPLSVILNAHENAVTGEMASRMLQLINNMLDVHRFESTEVILDRKEHSFQSIVDEAKEQVSFLLKEKDLKLESTLTNDYVVIADHAIIVRVLVNLLTNAIKYSPFNETISIACQESDQRLSVSVSDKGSGIPEDQKELIFSSFGQLDPQASGGIGSTGLGLTFVKLALRAHGSPIDVHSEPSVGTTFSFELPLLNVLKKEIIVDDLPADHPISFRLKNIVAGKINVLKSLDLHQVGEIERELEEIKGKHEEVDEWVEKVLNSVYAGNKVQYESLIQEVEEIN